MEYVPRFLEGGKCIRIEHLRPEIAVIGGCVAASEDMREMGRPVAHDDLGRHLEACQRHPLEGVDVERLGVKPRIRSPQMQIEIEQRG